MDRYVDKFSNILFITDIAALDLKRCLGWEWKGLEINTIKL